MHQPLEILQPGTKAQPTSASFNSQQTPCDKVSVPAVFYGCLLTAIVMEMIPQSPVVSPRGGDCCCSGLRCTADSKHGRLLLFCFRRRNLAVPGPFSAERPAQHLCCWGERCGVSPLSPRPASPLMGWVLEGESAIWQSRFCIRQVPFTISIQIKCVFPCNMQQAAFLGAPHSCCIGWCGNPACFGEEG